MKKIYAFFFIFLLCISLAACAGARRHSILTDAEGGAVGAIIDVDETERSKIDIPETTALTTLPTYFEVVATGTTASTTKKKPNQTEKPKEYYTVKFVDTDGYTAISVQTVAEGDDAIEPPMPKNRDELIFRGWDKDFSNIKSGMVVKAVYQKEWLTVRFFDADATLLKTAKVRYGDAATPPHVKDKGDFLFDGWNTLFGNVTEDIDVYATYYTKPTETLLPLADAFSLLDVKENTIELPVAAYYRSEYSNAVTIGKNEVSGNILYGNFCDLLPIDGYGFTSLEGTLFLDSATEFEAESYKLLLYVYVDGEQKYYAEVSSLGDYKTFSLDIEGAKEVTVRLETHVNDFLHYSSHAFVGGLADTMFK